MHVKVIICALFVFLGADESLAQTMPTGAITGRVVDQDNLPLAMAEVTVTSSSLQGVRSTSTSGNGDYIIPLLPAGEYEVRVERPGFTAYTRPVLVQVAESVTVNVQMSVGGLFQTLTVTAPGTALGATAGGASYRADLIGTLPIDRGLNGAVLLAPGTTATGPGGAITFSGAMSYEGLFLLNGVVLNETLRNQARPVFIEDAIEGVRVSTSNVSAEYGRFSGGVANVITRSGGNDFAGSFRATLDNDRWRALTPFEQANGLAPVDRTVPTYEGTFGGPVHRDRLWFFLAGRHQESTDSQTTRFTNLPYEEGERDQRFEVKGTWSFGNAHSLRGAYAGRNLRLRNASSGVVMDLASLSDRRDRDRLVSGHYAGALTSRLVVEGQYSGRRYRIQGFGSRFTDLQRGTIILDRSRDGARWNSPTLCGVCGPGGSETQERRDNRSAIAKGSYYWSTPAVGAHDVVFGVDAFEDSRQNDNWQSGSGYRLIASGTIIRDEGASLFPIIQAGTTPTQGSAAYIQWNPIFSSSIGSALRTYSGFLNDRWAAGPHWSFNLGVRWDRRDARDQGGGRVSGSAAWSPRVGATWDPSGRGTWAVNAGVARYTAGIASAISDLGSGAGRSSFFRYVYRGPSINTEVNAVRPVSAEDALTTVFNWFFANGGTNLPLRDAPTYAGINRVIGTDLAAPSAWDFSAGIGRLLGSRGSVRADVIRRRFRDFYAEQKDLTTGRAADPTGTLYDLGVIVNTNQMQRRYDALALQAGYAVSARVRLGGNYTLSHAWGNFEGEAETSGPAVAEALLYPEYSRARWSYPAGDLAIDERHNLRAWAAYEMPLGWLGRADVAVLHQVTSGSPLSSDAPVAVGQYVRNPGYLTPPPIGLYFFAGRGDLRADTMFATDLSINWSVPGPAAWPKGFVRVVVGNVFNGSVVRRPDDSVLTALLDPSLALFNPFTETPIEGLHYRRGPAYGQAQSADAWQRPRSISASAALRF